jgi:hypothetical protein
LDLIFRVYDELKVSTDRFIAVNCAPLKSSWQCTQTVALPSIPWCMIEIAKTGIKWVSAWIPMTRKTVCSDCARFSRC